MEKVVILSAKRTPIGKLGGELAGASAVDLGVTAAKAAIKAARLDPQQLDQAISGMFCRLDRARMLRGRLRCIVAWRRTPRP